VSLLNWASQGIDISKIKKKKEPPILLRRRWFSLFSLSLSLSLSPEKKRSRGREGKTEPRDI
jgi:hypothetical protein